MRLEIFALATILFFSVVAVHAAQFEERWVYRSGGLGDANATEGQIAFLKEAKAVGATHILFSDGATSRLGEMPPEYFENVKRFLQAAKELDIQVVPGIYSIGYSGRYLRNDPNLAAGIPVRDAPFIVTTGRAVPDATIAPALVNAGFEEADGDKLAGWTRQDFPGVSTFVDTEEKHSGAASLKVANLEKVAEEGGACRVGQTLKVKPFQFYRLTLWVKSDNIQAEREDFVLLFSGNGARRHCYTNLPIGPAPSWSRGRAVDANQWTEMSLTFNTFEADTIDFSVGVTDARSGTIWFDDLKIEPAGFAMLVRRELTPLVVTNEDKSVTYEEGVDFEPIPGMQLGGRRGAPEPERELKLTDNSRVKEGQRLLVSYFHTARIYDDQMVCSTQDPKVLEMMEDEMRRTAEAWPTNAYFMNYDEIRIGGWEVRPKGENLTLGQMLAKHTSTAVGFVRKYAPGANIYVWSDMYDPTHNARPFSRRNGYYYLCNGNWDGSWEGLPKDVIIMNWNGTENAAESLRWFASRGHKQVIAGYYDGDPQENLDMWLTAADGVPDVIGMMYTTWTPDYAKMPEFFTILTDELAKRARKTGEPAASASPPAE